MDPTPTLDAIEFADHGRVSTIWAGPGPAPHAWRAACQELGLLPGPCATAQEALLGGIEAIPRPRTQPGDLAA